MKKTKSHVFLCVWLTNAFRRNRKVGDFLTLGITHNADFEFRY